MCDRSIAKRLENPDRDVLQDSELYQFGDVGSGAGDPASIVVTNDHRFYLALAGVGEVAAGPTDTPGLRRLSVGIRPTALVANDDGSEIYVADTFGDSITQLHPYDFFAGSSTKPFDRISLGPQPSLSSADRGERLFFDARLSHGHWMSCHSCHTDGQSSDQLSDTLGDGSFGDRSAFHPWEEWLKRVPGRGTGASTIWRTRCGNR